MKRLERWLPPLSKPDRKTWIWLAVWLSTCALIAVEVTLWATRDRNCRVSRDFVFTVGLLVVITSPVLSTQYMVWLLGLAAVVLSAGSTRLRRPAWIVVGATALSTATFKSPELILLRDLALLYATIDAGVAMVQALRLRRTGDRPQKWESIPQVPSCP